MRMPLLGPANRALKPWRRRVRARWLTWRERREDAALQLARSAEGMFKREEIRLLYRTAHALRGEGDVAEIGSWMGRSTIVLARALRDGGQGHRRLFAIDHHRGSDEHADLVDRHGSTFGMFRSNLRRARVEGQVEPIVKRSGEAARELAERGVRLRLLFVDGAHDEASVRGDLEGFLPLVQPGGWVALHDCEPDGLWPDVWKAYQERLAPRVEEVGRAESLLVTRLRE